MRESSPGGSLAVRRLAGSTLALLIALHAGSARGMLTAEFFVSSPILGIATTNPSVQGQVGPLLQDFDQVVLPGTVATGSGEVHVSTEVDYGLCRLGASLDVNAADFDRFELSMDGGTRATGSFSDFVTIDAPGLTGTSGTFVAEIDLEGSLVASATGEDPSWTSSASADVLLTVSEPGFEQRSAGCTAVHGLPLACSGVLGVHVLAPMPFTYGTPFQLTARIDATTFNRTVPTGATAADASFETTVQWLGFQQVRDSGGATVASYSVTSTSGTDWSQPVPEPSRDLACAGAILAIAFIATRRRGSTTR
jgi:hypothetical protein